MFRFYWLLLCRLSYLFSEWIRGKNICESLRQKRESPLSPSDITHTIASALLQEHEFKYRLVCPKLMLMTLIFFKDYNPCGIKIITLFFTDDFLFLKPEFVDRCYLRDVWRNPRGSALTFVGLCWLGKQQFSPKNENCHYSLILMSFQT